MRRSVRNPVSSPRTLLEKEKSPRSRRPTKIFGPEWLSPVASGERLTPVGSVVRT